MEISSQEDYHQRFHPNDYLPFRYNEVDGVHHRHVFEGLHELFSSGEFEYGGKILELGCGPVIAWQISAAPYASEIVLGELVESNRDAVRLWLDKDPRAHNWTPFFRHVVQTLEGKGENEVAGREEKLRQAVQAVIPCDITKDPPVPPEYEGPYDLVMEIAVTDAVSNSVADYVAVWMRLAKLLKPGGILVSKTYLNDNPTPGTFSYSAGKEMFVAMDTCEKLLRESLKVAGFTVVKFMRSFTIESTHQLPHQEKSVFLTAVKNN